MQGREQTHKSKGGRGGGGGEQRPGPATGERGEGGRGREGGGGGGGGGGVKPSRHVNSGKGAGLFGLTALKHALQGVDSGT